MMSWLACVFVCCIAVMSVECHASAFKLDSGTWVKVRVDTTGVQEIGYDELRAAGFSDPSKVAVFGYGGLKLVHHDIASSGSDDLPAVPVAHVDGKLLFYAEGAVKCTLADGATVGRVRNAYSDAGYYFLTDSYPVKRHDSYGGSVSGQVVGSMYDSHVSVMLDEDEVECPSKGGTEYFGQNMAAQNRMWTLPLDIVDPVPNTTVSVAYAYAVKNRVSSALEFKFPADMHVSDYNYGRCSGISSDASTYYTRSTGAFRFIVDGTDRFCHFEPTVTVPSGAEFAAFDYVTVKYQRQNTISGHSSVEMYFPDAVSGDVLMLDGWGSDTRLWAVFNDSSVKECVADVSGTVASIVLSGDLPVKFVAFNASRSQYKAQVVSGVLQAGYLHALQVPQMLIVTTPSLKSVAEELAGIHERCQGMDVKVVMQGDIFNEFGSGTPHPAAIRSYIKRLYDSDSGRLKYILLYGGGRYDNRVALRSDSTALLTYQCELPVYMNQPTSVYCSDMYYGMLSDGFNHSAVYGEYCSVAVGRIPVVDEKQARGVNAKIRRYLENPPRKPLMNNALVICDDKDKNSHLNQAEDVVSAIEKASDGSVTCRKIYHALYPLDSNNDAHVGREMIRGILQQGVAYMCYTGHTNGLYLTGQSLWGVGSIAETRISEPPFAMWSTCESFNFDRMRSDIVQESLFSTAGGSIGAVGSCRVTYQDYNGLLLNGITDSLYRAEPSVMLGEVFRRARNGLVARSVKENDRRMSVNTLCYNYGGDPALPFYNADYKVEIDAFSEPMDMMAMNTVSGSVTDMDFGNLIEDFNGVAVITVYDGSYSRKTYSRGGDAVVDVMLDEDVLAEKCVPVRNGRFETELYLPQSRHEASVMRMSVYAYSDAPIRRRASGAVADIPVVMAADTDSSLMADVSRITAMYVDTPDFESGDVVGSDCSFCAEVLGGKSGINLSQQALGMNPRLRLDGVHTVKLSRTYNDEGCMVLSADIRGMSDGMHTLELDITDNTGIRITRKIDFAVSSQRVATMHVDERPAVSMATLSLDVAGMEDGVTGRLFIEDVAGNTVFNADDMSFPYSWNLCDESGTPVADGRYHAYAILRVGTVTVSTLRTEIVVVKDNQ